MPALALLLLAVQAPRWVTTEPEAPAVYAPGRPDMILISGGSYRLTTEAAGGRTVYRVVVPGTVKRRQGRIDSFAGRSGGSIIKVSCRQDSLSLALGASRIGREDPVVVLVQWKDAVGALRTCWAEDLIGELPRTGWRVSPRGLLNHPGLRRRRDVRANPSAVPAVGTKVRLIFRRATAEEIREIEKARKK